MQDSALWLSEENIASLVSLNDTIHALEQGVRDLCEGKGFNIPKALGSLSEAASMHSLGSARPEAGFCGYKNWVNTPKGAKSLFVLFDAIEGRLLAFMEANVLGQMRTSAMTGLGTKWLSTDSACDMAIIGSGRQALAQVAAVHAVRPLRTLRVWSPTAEKRHAFCEKIREQLNIPALEASRLEEATEGAHIVTTVTRARQPFLNANHLATSAHYNAVGAILPANAEFHQDVFERARLIVVDDIPNTRKASREFIDYFDQPENDWSQVQALGDVIAGNAQPSKCGDITLFKSMGMGISDLSVAVLAYQRALQTGAGMVIPLMKTAAIRWQE